MCGGLCFEMPNGAVNVPRKRDIKITPIGKSVWFFFLGGG